MARRQLARSFVRGPRKATDWSASSILTGVLSVAGSSAVLDEVFTPIVGGETIIRTRGMMGWNTDQEITDELQLGAFGLAIVSEQAATVGITAIPHPSTDAAWGGWFYHQFIMSKFTFISGVGVEPNVMQRMVVDSKAMRKVGENERLVSVWEATSTTGFEAFSSLRILSKVH